MGGRDSGHERAVLCQGRMLGVLLCVRLLSVVVINTMTKSKWQVVVTSSYRLQLFILEGSQGRTLKQKSWRNAACWMTLALSDNLLLRSYQLRGGTINSDLDCPINEKPSSSHGHAHKPVSGEQSLK